MDILEAIAMRTILAALVLGFVLVGLVSASFVFPQGNASPMTVSALNVTSINVSGPATFAEGMTGTASRIDAGTYLDTLYGLKNTSNKARLNLSASSGLEFGTGTAEGALKVDPADTSLALVSTGVKIGVNKIHLNVIAGGTAGDHNLAGIASGDELDGVLYVAKGTQNLTAVTDVYSEYSINATAGKISNWGGSTSAGGYLIISWLDRTA
jgi:hypothetical protein